MEMEEKSRCSILFHLLVAGGRWQTVIIRAVSVANRCNCIFHSRLRAPFEPPPSATIRSSLTSWIQTAPTAAPPASDTLHSKLRGLVITAHIDEAAVVDHIVNPVGNCFPVGDGAAIIHLDARVLPLAFPFSAVVLEVPNQ